MSEYLNKVRIFIISGLTAAGLGVAITWRRRKRRKRSFYGIKQRIDAAYDKRTTDKTDALSALGSIKTTVKTRFQDGKLSETYYNTLYDRVTECINKIREKDSEEINQKKSTGETPDYVK